MKCPKCGSTNVQVQAVSELKEKHHSILWWLLFGWYWVPLKWLCFPLIALVVKVFKPKKYKTVHNAMCICQDCGCTW